MTLECDTAGIRRVFAGESTPLGPSFPPSSRVAGGNSGRGSGRPHTWRNSGQPIRKECGLKRGESFPRLNTDSGIYIMAAISKSPVTYDKLSILSQDSRYDLACACGTREDEHRTRSAEGKWIYPVTLQNGQKTFLLKTLMSNSCVNDCRYCPLRVGKDPRRCTLEPEELVKVFLEYQRRGAVSGLFLSSGVIGTPDRTMDRIIKAASILRNKERFRGYIHLKVIPGASDSAVEHAVSLASVVSVNIETPGEKKFSTLCKSKNYIEDVIRLIKLVSSLTAKGSRYERVKQTTQFVVGAAGETDREIVRYSWGLYSQLRLHRVYFSAYQRGAGDEDLPGEHSHYSNAELLTREHRLYQVDWLLRKYGFDGGEIPFGYDGNLDLSVDPKEKWAKLHPEFFPVNINKADKWELLRVPGIGAITVNRILEIRKEGRKIRSMRQLGPEGKRLGKAREYIAL
jgi:predicted DNA-binding helix-hairpin-helix protein